MNHDYSGRYGAPRRRTPPSMPVGLSMSDSVLSCSDFSPTEHKNNSPMFSNCQNTQNHTSCNTPACDATPRGWGLKDHPLAMVYSPWQSFCALYDEDTAFSRGTLFSELDLPFEGHRCGKDRC